MNTKIFKITESSPDIAVLTECAQIIKNGGLVAFPTETVYGLGANALLDEACKKIFVAKNRPQEKALLCHVYDLEMAETIAVLNDKAKKLIAAFTPGPLTVIVPKKDCIGNVVSAGMDTVGLRFPSN
ncbi:MAG: L-threonylcarbamoyladenylate synthase, partial [Clostridia bacterium]